jgi:hypothetical protein
MKFFCIERFFDYSKNLFFDFFDELLKRNSRFEEDYYNHEIENVDDYPMHQRYCIQHQLYVLIL